MTEIKHINDFPKLEDTSSIGGYICADQTYKLTIYTYPTGTVLSNAKNINIKYRQNISRLGNDYKESTYKETTYFVHTPRGEMTIEQLKLDKNNSNEFYRYAGDISLRCDMAIEIENNTYQLKDCVLTSIGKCSVEKDENKEVMVLDNIKIDFSALGFE